MKSLFFCALISLITLPILAGNTNNIQNGDGDVLFSVGGEDVSKDEFEYVYRKNNPSKQNDYSRASLEEYLELYINFKLKVKEAKTLQIDTLSGVRSELERYRKQLVKSYFDKAVTNKLLELSYDRMLSEIQVNHVMVAVNPDASPEDTLIAYTRIIEIYEGLGNGDDFRETAMALSHDPTAKENGGDLGYITGLQIPDGSFEDAIFNTPKGTLSRITRTRYGYHIIKPGERRATSGTVKVAHILVKTPKNATAEQKQAALAKAQSVYEMANAGAPFDSLVSVYSEDKSTVAKGGELPEFGTGRMVAEFEKAAFSLQQAGQISRPVLTTYGYHVIKMIAKNPLSSYEDMKADITRNIQRSGRYDEGRSKYINAARSKYGFTENKEALDKFAANIDSSILINTWRTRKTANPNDVIFKLGSRPYLVSDFAIHVEQGQRSFRDRDIPEKISRLYAEYIDDMIVEFALGKNDEGFRRLLQEYRDGILLFELTEDKVWQEAMRDTVGLELFYNNHMDNYMWELRTEATIYTAVNADVAKKARKMLKKGATSDELSAEFNEEGGVSAITVESGLYLKDQNEMVEASKTNSGKDMVQEDGTIVFVDVTGFQSPTNKTLSEAKGYVISDYQEFLEASWVKELRAKYPVVVKQKILNAMVR
ncbi:MAG: peptidyl-prolyl cis-trans isomerase SurA [Limisphaerales bacterium]|jgi:peptidyl-prolyl cis-trans isomerase SurA